MSRTSSEVPSCCPDAGVFAVFPDRLPGCVFAMECVVALGIREIAPGGRVRPNRSPDEAMIVIGEETHALGDICFA